jgi:cytochrome c553
MTGHYKVPVAADGTVPHFRYAVEKTGEVQIVGFMCVTCHARVMPDGSVIYAAQSNMPVAAAVPPKGFEESLIRLLWSVPWRSPDPVDAVVALAGGEQAAVAAAMPPGVLPRIARSFTFPMQIPSLIGVKDRRYLDWTGLRQHRDIGDLMRYASFTADMDALIQYGDFIPAADARGIHGRLPDAAKRQRWSDEQLYALALYLESLEPPANPNKPSELTRDGEKVFEREGCATCHTAPIYTNNKLTPVKGFKVPPEHRKKFDITDVVVGTDPTVALETRGGTGYYRVPSLAGLWYRGPFEHNGSVATLEDWFDAARLRDDYVPTGYKGFGKTTRAVQGHEFGLKLSAGDKQALIAFLKTL